MDQLPLAAVLYEIKIAMNKLENEYNNYLEIGLWIK
jgi:hypothetical protein